jgi:hypothetical protein
MAMYLEGLGPREGRDFFELARSSTKPIIVYKAGRTEAGAKAAASHTASMSGDYDIFKAACDQAGVVLIDELPDFYHAVKAFSMLSGKKPRGRRVAGVVNAGLDATMGADQTGPWCRQPTAPNKRLGALNSMGSSTSDPRSGRTPMTDDVLFGRSSSGPGGTGTDCAFVRCAPRGDPEKDPTTSAGTRTPWRSGYRRPRRHDKPVVVSSIGKPTTRVCPGPGGGRPPGFPDIPSP